MQEALPQPFLYPAPSIKGVRLRGAYLVLHRAGALHDGVRDKVARCYEVAEQGGEGVDFSLITLVNTSPDYLCTLLVRNRKP